MWDMSTFDNTNAGGFMQGNDLQSPADKKKQLRRTQSVVPLTIRQIVTYPDEDVKLFGIPVQIVNIVGILKSMEVQSTKATCTIEDHTAEIKAVLWLENDNDDTSNIPPVKEGNYVQIFGSIRNQDGSKMIMILKICPVDDSNVVTNHLLQVIHNRLEAESSNRTKLTLNAPGSALATSMSEMDTSDVGQMTTGNTNTGLTGIQEKVFEVLRNCKNPAGMHRSQILSKFGKFQEREVNQAVEWLVSEGHAYSTVDNNHFKATDVGV